MTTQPADPVSEDAAIALADKEAALQLAAFNEEPWTKELGGPFLLQDYSRTVSLKTRGDETVFMVYYEYKRPVTFDGHPRHFSVWVNQATGAVRFFAGR